LITIGGMIVSKKVKAFLRTFKPKAHWHVGGYEAYNTFFCLKGQIKMNPNEFLEIFFDKIKPEPIEYQSNWLTIREKHARNHQAYLSQIPFSDFKVFDTVLASIPDNCMLQLSNSSTIRYAQLFDVNPSLQVYCNRGTSGIDGSTSTAIGAAVVSGGQTIFITGDLGFFYDSNALWNNHIPKSFRIIVINNQGGGIFRILPGYEETEHFKTYFETSHHLTAKQLCEMYGFEYTKADEMGNLNDELSQFYKISDKPKLLEIFTPRLINDKILKEYFNYIK
jgi:2-succinyl-5-enolpyruvyl-6-hydroxy-3-cyclohexene-1-carboxylate synthase